MHAGQRQAAFCANVMLDASQESVAGTITPAGKKTASLPLYYVLSTGQLPARSEHSACFVHLRAVPPGY